MRKKLKVFKEKIMVLNGFIFLIFFGCAVVPCLESDENLTSVVVENGGYKWNCGLSYWQASNDDLEHICDILGLSKVIRRTSVRKSNWRLDIYLNGEDEELVRNNLMLFDTKTNGFVFRKSEKYYSNDTLAKFLIQKLNITNSNSNPCNDKR